MKSALQKYGGVAVGLVLLGIPLLSFAAGSPSGNTMFVLQNPLNANNFCGLLKLIFNAVLALGIPVAMFFIVYAGFLFIVARGSPDKLKAARMNLLYVVIGIGIFLGAWFLSQIIVNTINAIGNGNINNSCI